MTTRVQRIGDRLAIVLNEQEMNTLCLHENDLLEVEAINGRLELTPAAKLPRHLESYQRTRAENAGVYAELAK